MRVNFELTKTNHLVGWAYDPDAKDTPVTLEFQTNNGPYTTVANLYRPHLERAGIRQGQAGFEVELDPGIYILPYSSYSAKSGTGEHTFPIPESLSASQEDEQTFPLFLVSSIPLFECTLVLIIKNEARYIEEWIEYHRVLGVSHFIVFDNRSTDHLRERLATYIGLGIVTYIDWPSFTLSDAQKSRGWPEQDVAYSCALKLLNGRSRWVGFIDVDEFIVLDEMKDHSLVELLRDFNSNVISLSWRLFGTSNLENPTSNLVISDFTFRAEDPVTATTKYIVKPGAVHSVINAHRVSVDKERITARTYTGQPQRSVKPVPADYERIWLNHYHSRSVSEYRAKVTRGWPVNDNTKNTHWEQHLRQYDRNEVEDLTAAALAPKVKEHIQKMRLAPLHSDVDNGWLLGLKPTVHYRLRANKTSEGIHIQGFILDLIEPERVFSLTFHDGYQVLSDEVSASMPSRELLDHGVLHNLHGFELQLNANVGSIYMCAKEMVAHINVQTKRDDIL